MATSFFRAQPRLATMLRKPGGVRVRDALKAADAALDEMRDSCLEAIDQALLDIEGLLAGWPGTVEAIYLQSTRIIDASGRPQERPLEIAARSLCDILDQVNLESQRTLEAVQVHVQAFKLLHRSDADEADRKAILQGLEAVCAKLLVLPPVRDPSDLLVDEIALAQAATDGA